MSPHLRAALAQPDYRDVFARAVLHADTMIRKYIWRGHPRRYTQSAQVMVGDKTAEDFVSEAVLRLIDGRRTFDANRSLLENLNSVIDSLISADKKHSDRTGVIDIIQENEQTGEPNDPVSTARDTKPPADQQVREAEILEDQRRCIDAIKRSFDGDEQMQRYLEALSAGFKRAEIIELMEIPGTKVDDLRRKLVKYARKFFGVTSFEELQRRLQEGN
jgi:DNA-directed RNA polymerase specialized sigma24 family protein